MNTNKEKLKNTEKRLSELEKRLSELEKHTDLNVSNAIEAYNVAIINKQKIKELKRKVRRCKNGK